MTSFRFGKQDKNLKGLKFARNLMLNIRIIKKIRGTKIFVYITISHVNKKCCINNVCNKTCLNNYYNTFLFIIILIKIAFK